MRIPDAMRGRRRGIVLAVVLLALVGNLSAAFAAEKMTLEVGVVLASNEGNTVDKALSGLKSKLQSMFNYTSYNMLDRQRASLAVGETRDFGLPGERQMRATVASIEGNKVRLDIQITDASRKILVDTKVGLNRGGMFLVGGPAYQNGKLILILSAE